MATKKITELTAANTLSGNSLLVAVTNPSGAATTNKITVANFFGNISTTVAVTNTVSITGTTTVNTVNITTGNVVTLTSNVGTFSNTLAIPYRTTPANSTALAITNNAIFHDGTYLYVAVGTNTTKRVLLSSF
jgi:hypothetical protein